LETYPARVFGENLIGESIAGWRGRTAESGDVIIGCIPKGFPDCSKIRNTGLSVDLFLSRQIDGRAVGFDFSISVVGFPSCFFLILN
jgi:hypothetical protein